MAQRYFRYFLTICNDRKSIWAKAYRYLNTLELLTILSVEFCDELYKYYMNYFLSNCLQDTLICLRGVRKTISQNLVQSHEDRRVNISSSVGVQVTNRVGFIEKNVHNMWLSQSREHVLVLILVDVDSVVTQ